MKGMEDVYMMFAIADEHASAYIAMPVTHYRVHEQQSTRHPDLLNAQRELDHRMLVAARILAGRSFEYIK
jgi:hypothetical protein